MYNQQQSNTFFLFQKCKRLLGAAVQNSNNEKVEKAFYFQNIMTGTRAQRFPLSAKLTHTTVKRSQAKIFRL